MTRDDFWKIVEQSRSKWNLKVADGNMDRQCKVLTKLLKLLDREDLISFATHFYQVRSDAYQWNLWAAAYVMSGGGCSDDGFMDFRNWLISMGRKVYEAALKNPESLAKNSADPGVEDFYFEEFNYVAHREYEEKFGEELPELKFTQSEEPLGDPFSEDAEYLKKLLPKLFKAYWKD